MKTYNPKKSGSVIYVINNDINKALNLLKHDTAQLLKELKNRRYFESNTEKRRRKRKESIARERIKMRKLEILL